LPISVIGFESWKGVASLPLSLGAFCVGLGSTVIIASFYPDKKDKNA
jgi:hypothetical protein